MLLDLWRFGGGRDGWLLISGQIGDFSPLGKSEQEEKAILQGWTVTQVRWESEAVPQSGGSPPNPALSPDPTSAFTLNDTKSSAIPRGQLHVSHTGLSPQHPCENAQSVNPAPQQPQVPCRCKDLLYQLHFVGALVTAPVELTPWGAASTDSVEC